MSKKSLNVNSAICKLEGKTTRFALNYDTIDYAKKFDPKYRLQRNGLIKVERQPKKLR